MNNLKKNMVYLQCFSKQAADVLRKQPCLVRTENLDNSLYTRRRQKLFTQLYIIVSIPLRRDGY